MPEGASLEIWLTLGITAGALALFLWNRIRMDVVGLMVMAALIVTGLVTPQEGVSGFSNEAMITVAAMFVLSSGLVRTGVVDILGRWVSRLARGSEFRLLVVALLMVIPVSAFINNTPVIIVMLPVLMGICREIGASPSKVLMPVSFASQMGGTLTLIGTSTNLLVAGLVLELGLDRIRLFDITPPALVLMLIGVLYLLTIGRWLSPEREAEADLAEAYELREYLTGLRVRDDSALAGQTLADVRFGQRFGLQVVAIERKGVRISFPTGHSRLQPGDLLIVRGSVSGIAAIERSADLRISHATPEILLEEEERPDDIDMPLAEIMVPPRSRIEGRTLRDLGFRARYGLTALALQRHGEARHEPIASIPLEPGDIILVQGPRAALNDVQRRGDLAVLGSLDIPPKRTGRRWIAIAIMTGVILAAFLEVATILVAAIVGVVAMFVTGCVKPDEAYRDVDWMVLVLLGSIIPLGIAMQNTGTAALVANGLLQWVMPLGLFGVLAVFYLLTAVLTAIISNNAAAVVMAPIALATAATLGVSPLPFVIGVMIAASNSYMTPIGYQTNTFIYAPGGYRFTDFVRVGGLLNLIMVAAATFVIPIFFPF